MLSPIYLYRIGNYCFRKKIPLVPKIIHRLCYFLCHADIPMNCVIGRNVQFGHFGNGVVINDSAVIHDNVIIYHGVTIGRSRGIIDRTAHKRVSIEIGENTLIGAHAIILAKGDGIKIGSNCEIGAGAVVFRDVPDNCVAIGNPAVIKAKATAIG